MLARSGRLLTSGDFAYEVKWDGFGVSRRLRQNGVTSARMTVRDATLGDLGSVRDFLRAYVDEFWNRPFPRPEFDPEYVANGKVIVAEEHGSVVGMAKGVLDRGCGHISFIYVDPQSRRCGCGTALLRMLCEWFAEREVVSVTVGADSSNPNALAFWEKLSFREFHRELTAPLDAFKERL